MFFYSFYIVLWYCLFRFSPPGRGFFDTFDWPFVSHPGEFDQKILKFVKSPPLARTPPPPHGVYFDRCIKPTIRDKSSWHTCLKRVLLSTISYICYFILFKHRKSPHPRINVVCSKRKTWGSETQHWFRREGWEYTGEGNRYVHCSKGGHFIEVSQHVCPSL